MQALLTRAWAQVAGHDLGGRTDALPAPELGLPLADGVERGEMGGRLERRESGFPRSAGGQTAVDREAGLAELEGCKVLPVWAAEPGGIGIKIGLPGKSILRDHFQENRTSERPFLLLRISFPERPIFIQFVPGRR